jgi:hypothetical protein
MRSLLTTTMRSSVLESSWMWWLLYPISFAFFIYYFSKNNPFELVVFCHVTRITYLFLRFSTSSPHERSNVFECIHFSTYF